MKKLLTMLSVICVIALSLTAFAILAGAGGPTVIEGDVIEAMGLVERFKNAENDEQRLEYAKELNVYVFAYPISEITAEIVLEKVYGEGEALYSQYLEDLYKINAYGAALALRSYDGDASIRDCRNVLNWVSRFFEHGVDSLTVEEALALFSSDAPSGEEEAEPVSEASTMKEIYDGLYAVVEERVDAAILALSGAGLAEYGGQILYQPDLSEHNLSLVYSNASQAAFHGIVYDSGYRRDDYIPKRQYIYNGVSLSYTTSGGTHDLLQPGTYVIFKEGVDCYYTGTRVVSTGAVNNPVKHEGVVKRNYIFDYAVNDFVDVGEGNGLYDLITRECYGELCVPDSYFLIDTNGKTSGSAAYSRFSSGIAPSAVFQFDIAHFSESGHISISVYCNTPAGSAENKAVFAMDQNGNLKIMQAFVDANGVSQAAGTGVGQIVPGRWTNVAIAVDASGGTGEVDVYIDYELVGSVSINFSNSVSYVSSIRAYTALDTYRGFALDNVVVYEGSVPRKLDMLESMTAYEKFVYLGNYITGDGPTTAKMYAYRLMEASLTDYFIPDLGFEGSHINEDGEIVGGIITLPDDEVMTETLKKYFSFDIETVLAEYREIQVAQYAELVDKYVSTARLYSSITTRESAKKAVETFLASCCDDFGNPVYIDEESSDYKEAKRKFDQATSILENDKISLAFVEIMERYGEIKLYSKKYDAYSEAVEYMKKNAIDETVTDAGETRLAAALLLYNNAPDELEQILIKNNTRDLAMYLSYTVDFDTVESWEANYDNLSYALSHAREIITSGKYLPDAVYNQYGSIPELMAWYNTVNDYFYAKLQEEHIAYINELHSRYMNTDSYMEKLAICTETKRFFEEEDVDPDNQQLSILKERSDAYYEEVMALKDTYMVQRDKNTELFVTVVKKFVSADSYNEIVEYIDEALAYYYTMTVGATDTLTDEEVNEAVDTYLYYVELEEKMRDSTAAFILLSGELNSADKLSKKYAILSQMAELYEYVSADIEGADAAISKYQSTYDAYMATVNPAIEEIGEIQLTVIAVRAKAAASALINLFANIVANIG